MLKNPCNIMFFGNHMVSCTVSRSRSNQRMKKLPTKSAGPDTKPWTVAGGSMDSNPNLTNLTLDALKSFMSQILLGKFTAVFPKLFKSQWKTYEGQKKVS